MVQHGKQLDVLRAKLIVGPVHSVSILHEPRAEQDKARTGPNAMEPRLIKK